MPSLAAIDIGSNAIRLVIATADSDGDYAIIQNFREPVRLGQDVFATGSISAATLDKSVEAFKKFRELIDKHGVGSTKAVATSAVREAANREVFVSQIAGKCGISVSVIGPEEEARLTWLALRDRIDSRENVVLLIDIGGGSVEVSLAAQGGILSTDSYRIGSVRLLQVLGQPGGEKQFHQLIDEFAGAVGGRLNRELGDRRVGSCAGTGGSIESIGKLRCDLLGENNAAIIRASELGSIAKTLQHMSTEERIQQLKLRPDRADVIVPAAIVLESAIHQAGVEEVMIPGVGLKEGLILEMASHFRH